MVLLVYRVCLSQQQQQLPSLFFPIKSYYNMGLLLEAMGDQAQAEDAYVSAIFHLEKQHKKVLELCWWGGGEAGLQK
jgi:hypothetical protein